MGLGDKEGSVIIRRILYVFSYLQLFLTNPHSFLRLAQAPGSRIIDLDTDPILTGRCPSMISFGLIYAQEGQDSLDLSREQDTSWVSLRYCLGLLRIFCSNPRQFLEGILRIYPLGLPVEGTDTKLGPGKDSLYSRKDSPTHGNPK